MQDPSKPFPPGSLVAGYFRDSGGADQDLSVQQQQAVFRLWCTENGYAPGRIFADVAKSGGSTAGRDQLDQLLAYLQAGAREAGVAFWDYSRLARNFDDGQYILSTIRRRGYQVYSLEEFIPPGSVGKIVEALHLWRAEEYRVELARNVKRGLHHLVDQGCWPGGGVPVGYTLEPVLLSRRRDGKPHTGKKLVLDPEKMDLVRKAFELRAAGATLLEILKEIPIAGNTPSMGRILRNLIYTGVFEYGERTLQDFCEPLISPELWQAAQLVNQGRQSRFGSDHPRRVRSRFFLTGLIKCGRCGLPLQGHVGYRGSKVYEYYRCQARAIRQPCPSLLIPKAEVESRVIDRIRELANRPQFFDDLLEKSIELAGARSKTGRGKLEGQRSQLAGTSAAIDRLTLAIAAAGHSPALLARLKDLEARQAELELGIAELEREVDAARPEVTREALAERLARLAELVDKAEPRFRSQALRSLVRQIEAKKVNGELSGSIYFYPLFGGEEDIVIDL
jgi:site-specific DNA recombinase